MMGGCGSKYRNGLKFGFAGHKGLFSFSIFFIQFFWGKLSRGEREQKKKKRRRKLRSSHPCDFDSPSPKGWLVLGAILTLVSWMKMKYLGLKKRCTPKKIMDEAWIDEELEDVSTPLKPTYNNELKVGTIFKTIEEARVCYEKHAGSNGFSIRKKTSDKSKSSGMEIGIVFVCCREGSHKRKNVIDSDGKTKKLGSTSRIGCKAKMRLKLLEASGSWEVSILNDVHNHELVTPSKRMHLKSNKIVPREAKLLAERFKEQNLPISKVPTLFGDRDKLTFDDIVTSKNIGTEAARIFEICRKATQLAYIMCPSDEGFKKLREHIDKGFDIARDMDEVLLNFENDLAIDDDHPSQGVGTCNSNVDGLLLDPHISQTKGRKKAVKENNETMTLGSQKSTMWIGNKRLKSQIEMQQRT